MFLFYMAPLVPFLILGLTLALGVMLGPAVAGGPGDDAARPAARRRGAAHVGHRRRRRVYLGLVDRRLRLDVADLHRRPAHLRRVARAYVAPVLGMPEPDCG